LLLVTIVSVAKAAGARVCATAGPRSSAIMVGLLLGPTAISTLRLWPFASTHDSPGYAVIAGIEEAKFGGETSAQGMQKENGTVSSPQGGA
jgi:hypothetical protein